MKHSTLIIIFLLFTFCANAQQTNNISIGKKETIYSKIFGENRKLWIYTPDITSKIPNPQKKYPVLFVLDGDAHFYSTVGIIQQLSQANGNGILPEIIVVGVASGNEVLDHFVDVNKMVKLGSGNEREIDDIMLTKYACKPFMTKTYEKNNYSIITDFFID